MTFREKIRDIIHNDLAGNDDVERKIADQIISLIEKEMPKEKGKLDEDFRVNRHQYYKKVGYNQAIADVKEKIRG